MKTALFLISTALCLPLFAAPDYDASLVSFRKLLDATIAADTTNPPGNEAKVVRLVARVLDEEKIPYEITEFAPGRENLVARLKGDGSMKPLMLLAHTDIVGTENQQWTVPPHQVTEKDGYLYGRGTGDDLGNAILSLETMLMIKRAGVPLKRDIILALTGDEETSGLGIRYLLDKHPEQVNAELALNEGGGIVLNDDGSPKFISLQVAEKTNQDFEVSVQGTTGHSSIPLPDNAIFALGKALQKLSAFQNPLNISPLTTAYFSARAPLEPPAVRAAMIAVAKAPKGKYPKSALQVLEKDPVLSSSLRTTCVATLVSGGTRTNALPASAQANINCRIMPGESTELVRSRLVAAIGDKAVSVKPQKAITESSASPVDGVVPVAILKGVKQTWPKVPVIPVLSRGATDSLYLRAKGIHSYGFSPIPKTEADGKRAHGIDERISIAALKPGLEFFHRLVLELAAK